MLQSISDARTILSRLANANSANGGNLCCQFEHT